VEVKQEPAPALIDIAIPAATPVVPVVVEAKASAPAMPSADRAKSASKPKARNVKVAQDPFSGLVLTPVSDSQLNRFVFPEPIEGIYLSEGAPWTECPENAGPQDSFKPVFMNGKRMMLLQFRAAAKGPVQMLVHLHSGRITTLNLAPGPGPG